MGWAARIFACGAALSIVACAAIAGLEDPHAEADATSGDGSVQDTGNSSSSSSSSSSSGTPSDGAPGDAFAGDAPADAPPDAPPCALAKIGDNCTQPSQCCSGKCNEKKQCATACTPMGMFNCDPTSDDDCCVGLWCNTGSCSGCIDSGQPAAETLGGLRLARSCCSRSLQNGIGPNCQ